MKFTGKEYIEIIESEKRWCENNRDKGCYFEDVEKNKIYQDAFISGLNQAQILIERFMSK